MPQTKQALKAYTAQAVKRGAYGSPTMIVHGGAGAHAAPFLVFGSDRFEQIAHCCKLPWMGPDPSQRKSSL